MQSIIFDGGLSCALHLKGVLTCIGALPTYVNVR